MRPLYAVVVGVMGLAPVATGSWKPDSGTNSSSGSNTRGGGY